jgi:hypothetical protein
VSRLDPCSQIPRTPDETKKPGFPDPPRWTGLSGSVTVVALDEQAAFEFGLDFAEELDHALAGGFVEDRGERVEVLHAALDEGEHVLGRGAIEEAGVAALEIEG